VSGKETPPVEYLIMRVLFENGMKYDYHTRIYDREYMNLYERSMQKVYDKLKSNGQNDVGSKAKEIVAIWQGAIDSEPPDAS